MANKELYPLLQLNQAGFVSSNLHDALQVEEGGGGGISIHTGALNETSAPTESSSFGSLGDSSYLTQSSGQGRRPCPEVQRLVCIPKANIEHPYSPKILIFKEKTMKLQTRLQTHWLELSNINCSQRVCRRVLRHDFRLGRQKSSVFVQNLLYNNPGHCK